MPISMKISDCNVNRETSPAVTASSITFHSHALPPRHNRRSSDLGPWLRLGLMASRKSTNGADKVFFLTGRAGLVAIKDKGPQSGDKGAQNEKSIEEEKWT